MKNCVSRLFLMLSGIFYASVVCGETADFVVEMNTSNPNYTNEGSITTENGYGIWLNGINGFSGSLINSGTISVTGDGYGIYETPYETRPVKLSLQNTGTIQRIQLEETDGSVIENGSQRYANNYPYPYIYDEELNVIAWGMTNNDSRYSPFFSDGVEDDVVVSDMSDAVIQGSVLLGVNAKIYNTNGVFKNLELDENFEKGNLISLGRDSEIINGNVLMTRIEVTPEMIDSSVSSEDLASITQSAYIYQPIFTTAKITTDYIQFSKRGTLSNRSFIDNKSIVFGDDGTLMNIGMPYVSANIFGEMSEGATSLTTGILSFGNNGVIIQEMGTNLKADTLIMGNNASLTGGADYSFAGDCSYANPYCKILKVTKHYDSEGEAQKFTATSNIFYDDEHATYYSYNPTPHFSVIDIQQAQLGNESTIDFLNGEVKYQGETISMGDNATFNMVGAEVMLTSDSGDSFLRMGENSQLTLKSTSWYIVQPEMIITSEVRDEEDLLNDIAGKLDVLLGGGTISDATDYEAATVIDVIDAEYKSSHNEIYTYPDTVKSYMDMLGGMKPFEIFSYLTTDILSMGDKSIIEGELAAFNTQKINLGNDASFTMTGGFANADDYISFGDKGTFTLKGFDLGDDRYLAPGVETKTLLFRDYGTLNMEGGIIKAKDVWFGDYGTVELDPTVPITNQSEYSSGQILAETLTMGHDSVIHTAGYLTPFITMGSDSIATMYGMGTSPTDEAVEDVLKKEDFITASGLVGGFTKAPGATNVKIVSDVPLSGVAQDESTYHTHGWLAGGVYADHILINQGELWAQDSIRSPVDINANSSLRVVGTQAVFYNPISKVQGATNTKLIVDLDGSNNFYETSNTVNVDHIVLLGGGFTIQNPVRAEDITFGSDTTLRLRGNYYVGDMREWHDEAVNTSLNIDAGEGNTIYSTGTMRLDRLLVETGIFDVNHKMEMVYTADNASVPGANEQGVELSTNTVINFNYADAKVNRVVRNQLALKEGETVENTTVNMNGGNLQIERNVDVDTLNVNAGKFEFLNEDTNNVVNVGERVYVKTNAQIAGDGVFNIKNGTMDIDYGGRLSVSTQSLDDKALGKMEVIQSAQTYFDADSIPASDKGNATVNMASGSILDLRADGAESDKIVVSGTVNIADGTRVILRGIEANQTYELMSATQLNGNVEKIASSFLWSGTQLTNNANHLMLKVSGVQTLNEGISSTKYSQNVWNIARAMSAINESRAATTVDPFLDNIFYALSADTAVQVMNEYSPEGYLNAYQNVLRTNKTFRQSALSELDAMRTYSDVENGYQKSRVASYNPNYYGRPGYEAYYANWTNNRNYRQRYTRTDRGGLWAKPFAVSVTQDDKENMSGYEIKNHGLTAGIDRRFGSLSLGLMGLYATGSINQADKTIETDTSTYGLGIYGNYRPYRTRRFFDFYALWTETKNKSTHKVNSLVESAKADYNITGHSFGADMGYDMPLTRNLIITPKVGVDYTQLKMDAIEETGKAHSLLGLTANKMTSLQTPIEIRAAFNYTAGMNKFKPEVHARWTHEFGDTAATGKGVFKNYNQSFMASGLNADKDVFTLGGSLLWLYNVSELELRYDYDFSSSSTGHTINMGYKYLF